jgi:hypothetical protein
MLITIQDIRNNFRVETAVPDAVIQRHIDYVDTCYTNNFGAAYTDVVLDPTTDVELAGIFRDSQLYLTMARLLGDRYVLTGFGLVEKRDEYSNEVSEEKYLTIARQLVKDASTILHRFDHDKVTDCIQDCSVVTEGFFEKKSDCTLHRYFPYTHYWL